MIPGDVLSAFPHRQFHTLPGLLLTLDSWAALPNSYPNACMPMQGGSLYHFYDGLECNQRRWVDKKLPLLSLSYLHGFRHVQFIIRSIVTISISVLKYMNKFHN